MEAVAKKTQNNIHVICLRTRKKHKSKKVIDHCIGRPFKQQQKNYDIQATTMRDREQKRLQKISNCAW
jgi:hypothetical protein